MKDTANWRSSYWPRENNLEDWILVLTPLNKDRQFECDPLI